MSSGKNVDWLRRICQTPGDNTVSGGSSFNGKYGEILFLDGGTQEITVHRTADRETGNAFRMAGRCTGHTINGFQSTLHCCFAVAAHHPLKVDGERHIGLREHDLRQRKKFSRRALDTTQKLLRLMAAAPNIGFIRQPSTPINTPAANGMPSVL